MSWSHIGLYAGFVLIGMGFGFVGLWGGCFGLGFALVGWEVYEKRKSEAKL